MSVFINCSAYMALVYEIAESFLIMVRMIKFAKIMKVSQSQFTQSVNNI